MLSQEKQENAMRCNNRDDLLQISSKLASIMDAWLGSKYATAF